MCGRFTQKYSWREVQAFLSVIGAPLNLRPRYNVAPTTDIDVVRLNDEGQRELLRMRWGLVPGWWKKTLREAPTSFNARSEEVAAKPMYRDAWRRGRRLIVPASGFFEWTGPKTDRVPHYFTAADGSPLIGFAGIWDRWRNPETGDDLLSATILTTGVSQWMATYHNRMPVILRPEDFERWLSGEMGADELGPTAEQALREWRISTRVNKSGEGDDDPTIVEAAEVNLL